MYFNKKIAKYKYLEIEAKFADWASIFLLEINYTTKKDHAGFTFNFSCFKIFYFGFNFYDCRHWNYKTNTCKAYTDKKIN